MEKRLCPRQNRFSTSGKFLRSANGKICTENNARIKSNEGVKSKDESHHSYASHVCGLLSRWRENLIYKNYTLHLFSCQYNFQNLHKIIRERRGLRRGAPIWRKIGMGPRRHSAVSVDVFRKRRATQRRKKMKDYSAFAYRAGGIFFRGKENRGDGIIFGLL